MILDVVYYNDPILRKKAEPIAEITDEIRTLAKDMVETCLSHDALGIAAPQVGVSLRMFVINVPDEEDPDKTYPGHPLVLVNPKLSNPCGEEWVVNEGCLSIPGMRGDVWRPSRITVNATTIDGEIIDREFDAWEARVVMHENDHINGVLYPDRMNKKDRQQLEPLLRDLAKSTRKKKK